MKKMILFGLALILLLSFASAYEAQPYTKQDFNDRMDRALAHNREQSFLFISYLPNGEVNEDAMKKMQEDLARLDELKVQAVNEYSEFYDFYYAADLVKTREQQEKLKTIFDEMNPLMVTIVKFEGIYGNIFYWTVLLDYSIEQGIINPDQNIQDNTKPITAIKEKTASDNPVTDCCKEDSKSECCKLKQQFDQPQLDLLIPIVVGLIIIVFGAVYAIFIRKS
jgi:hypothetical protein